jgi:hypothetical protein
MCCCLMFQRSYRKELFDDAVARMRKAMIKSETEIERFRLLQERIDELVVAKQRAEIDLGDIPDEFKGTTNFGICNTFYGSIDFSDMCIKLW